MLSTWTLAAALPSLAYAATYEVTVGQNGLVFEPPVVNAVPGDTVHFTFFPKAHSVTQSSFAAPCSPYEGGFDSGLMPTTPEDTIRPEYTLTINNTDPIYFYCKQPNGNHCGNGMVAIINPGENSIDQFREAAIASGGVAPPPASDVAPAATYTTPPPQSWEVVSAPITYGESVWTTVYTSYAGTPQPTYAPEPVEHRIIVGVDGQLAYGDANITAAIGDTVTWEFRPKNHTVTQSSFPAPCVPLEVSTGQPGFKSGFQPVGDDTVDYPTYSITINDTAPIWYYCGQTSHCGKGMVGSINAVESGPNNFAAFQELAKQINGTVTASGDPTSATGGASDSDDPDNAGFVVSSEVAAVGSTLSVIAAAAIFAL